MNIFIDHKRRAKVLDKNDPLAAKRAEFELPEGIIYLDGNSLGPLPKAAKTRALEVVEQQWGVDLIGSWNSHDWINLPQRVGEKIAPLLGAASGQVVCCDSTSVNLFKLLAAALTRNEGRSKILSQRDNFPTDLYMMQGMSALLGTDRCQLLVVEEDEVAAHLDKDVAVLVLTQVNFRTGKIHDIERLTQLAHAHGILVIWDLAHSAGVLPLQLDKWQVDFAVGCGYKFLNGGPGAPAFVYVAERHLGSVTQPLSGWMGHAAPFEFSEQYCAGKNIKQFLCGTPGVIGMSVLDASLDVFNGVSMQQLRSKSLALTDYCLTLITQCPALGELELVTPLKHKHRASQMAFRHAEAYAICQALIGMGVVADFRAPDILRLGFSPLFLRFEDVCVAVERLNRVFVEGIYRREEYRLQQAVT